MPRHATATKWTVGLFVCVVGSVVAALAAPAAARAAGVVPYSLQVSALTGPQGGLLRIEVDAGATVPAVTALKYVQVSVNGQLTRVLSTVPAPDGVAEIELGPVPRGATVSAKFYVRDATQALVQLGRATIARLRPDLVVAAVQAPPQTLSTRPIDVVADVSELNGDVGATATLTLMLGPTPLAEPKTVTVPKGGSVSVQFPGVNLTTAMSAELSVLINEAVPFETDATNNAGSSTVEVTEHELVRSNVLVQALGGYGAQFNQHVYAPITNAPPESLPDMEAKVKALEPQLVRIFYNDNWEERRADAPDNMASFIETVRLAQEAGATINITYQTASVARLQPQVSMARFAGVLEDLVANRGFINVRWVTVQNEPNSAANLTLPQYEALYRALDAELAARGLGEHISLMGGDLVESSSVVGSNHRNWFAYMAANMNDIVDAYSVHIYWNYWDTPRMEFRLKDVRKIVAEELSADARKPTYIMEFGVRGANTFAGKPTVTGAYWQDGTELRRTNVAAFQQLWCNLVSAQLGYSGTSKWDAFWGVYDLTLNNQSYWTTGTAAEGWPLFPAYHALRMLFQTTQQGWQVVQVAPWADDDWKVGVPDQPEKEIAAYTDDTGHLTLMGLDTHARNLNTVSADPAPTYSIGGLTANTTFNLVLWNATGNGENSLAGTVTANAAGVARFEVPLQAAFSLTTVPVS